MARGKREPAKINANLQKSDAMHALAPYLYVLRLCFLTRDGAPCTRTRFVEVLLSYIRCRSDMLACSLTQSIIQFV
jgi:hypothetical protein